MEKRSKLKLYTYYYGKLRTTLYNRVNLSFLFVNFSSGKTAEQKSQGSELNITGVGWDQVCDYQGGIYYVTTTVSFTSLFFTLLHLYTNSIQQM